MAIELSEYKTNDTIERDIRLIYVSCFVGNVVRGYNFKIRGKLVPDDIKKIQERIAKIEERPMDQIYILAWSYYDCLELLRRRRFTKSKRTTNK